jgi:hypothetical protein
VKYWFSVSDAEQERRFQARVENPVKQWKLSPMDLESRRRQVDYSRAKDEVFVYTDAPGCPWHVVESDDKRAARVNCVAHLRSVIPYQRRARPEITLPTRQARCWRRGSAPQRGAPVLPRVCHFGTSRRASLAAVHTAEAAAGVTARPPTTARW